MVEISGAVTGLWVIWGWGGWEGGFLCAPSIISMAQLLLCLHVRLILSPIPLWVWAGVLP